MGPLDFKKLVFLFFFKITGFKVLDFFLVSNFPALHVFLIWDDDPECEVDVYLLQNNMPF